MEIQKKKEVPQKAFNHSLDINFQDFVNLYKKCTANPYFFWLLILLVHQIILYVLERIL